jgi:hypothetical protein
MGSHRCLHFVIVREIFAYDRGYLNVLVITPNDNARCKSRKSKVDGAIQYAFLLTLSRMPI